VNLLQPQLRCTICNEKNCKSSQSVSRSPQAESTSALAVNYTAPRFRIASAVHAMSMQPSFEVFGCPIRPCSRCAFRSHGSADYQQGYLPPWKLLSRAFAAGSHNYKFSFDLQNTQCSPQQDN
jgi:hypothetical protein